MALLSDILNWWDENVVPTVAQRLATFNSFRHKDDSLPMSDIDGLENALNGKADIVDFSAKADLVGGKVPTAQLPDNFITITVAQADVLIPSGVVIDLILGVGTAANLTIGTTINGDDIVSSYTFSGIAKIATAIAFTTNTNIYFTNNNSTILKLYKR